MPVAIIDTLTTVTEVCLLQGHNMNVIVDDASARIYSDDLISTVINNVIRFVYANRATDITDELTLFCVNTLSKIALNNVMAEDGYLPNYTPEDPFDKIRLFTMLQNLNDEDSLADAIPMYRNQLMGGEL